LKSLCNIGKELDDFAREETQKLGMMAHAHMIELANERLHSRRQKYLDNLSFKEEDGAYIMELSGDVLWIEDGVEPHNMLQDLLASPKAKRSKDGSTYLIVPFDKSPGKGASNTPASQMDLVDTVKKVLKQNKIPWATIERFENGQPKLGRLHKLDIMDQPLKTKEGPGQGKGKIGDVRQGNSGIPFLKGLSIYQHDNGKGGVTRSILTFRIASSKHQGSGKWDFPGLTPINIFPDTQDWCVDQIEKLILPDLMARFSELR
jgi:hypothetical protein